MTTTVASTPTTTPVAPLGALAPLPTAAITPTGTLSNTLAHTPTSSIPYLENPANLLPVFALFGVFATIIFGWKKMKVELKALADQATIERDQSRDQATQDRQHAADQAHQERITKARREVYLDLIGEMTKAQMALGLLPAQDIEKLDIHAGFGGLITATSKISILAEMRTVATSRELLTAIQESLFRVMPLLIPINNYKAAIKYDEEKFAMRTLEIEYTSEKIDDLIHGRTGDGREMGELEQTLTFLDKEAQKHGNAALEAKLALSEEQKKYTHAVLGETIIISRKVDELIFSIRSELGLTTSREQLEASTAAMYSAASTAAQNMYSALSPTADK